MLSSHLKYEVYGQCFLGYSGRFMSFDPHRFFYLLFFSIFFMATLTPCHAEQEIDQGKPVVVKKTVIIDPGHGGEDLGAVGPDRTQEKGISLSFSKMLEARLSKKYKTVMTRKGDRTVEPRARTEAANKAHGDLLLSVHAGGGFSREAHGIRLYFHEVRWAEADASALGRAEDSGHAMVRWNSVQDRYRSLSRTLALIMNETLSSLPAEEDRMKIMVLGLPDVILAGADMPALHLEIGQLTSPADEKRLKQKDHLGRLADAVLKAVDTFFDQYPDKTVQEF